MIPGWILGYAQDFILNVLASGPIPRHVAFVMDGNRRYARRNHKKVQQGHSDGFVALRRVLEVCLKLNIKCVSAYAFSIENFKRSAEEVDALMGMAEEKLVELCNHGDLLDQYGVRLNVIGRTNLLPESVRAAVKKAEDMTRNNTRAILNLCMPYTSRDEMVQSVEACVRHAAESDQWVLNYVCHGSQVTKMASVISEKDIEDNLLTSLRNSPPLDVLIRTSGVKRLSDFLLWQCCENTQIQYTDTYWPDFGLFELIPILLDYQRKVWSS
ncbi:dehydrodolichyl diphosphate synthetase [Coprinopsis sp. MPI-PUGE-AT-0042]|nr:dehydrodolichyl diphosphate synthetase [Coprinopsis sp. MPI-PUGE-AT-0042]